MTEARPHSSWSISLAEVKQMRRLSKGYARGSESIINFSYTWCRMSELQDPSVLLHTINKCTHRDGVDLPVFRTLHIAVAHRLKDPLNLLLHRLVVLAAATGGAIVLLLVNRHETEHELET